MSLRIFEGSLRILIESTENLWHFSRILNFFRFFKQFFDVFWISRNFLDFFNKKFKIFGCLEVFRIS